MVATAVKDIGSITTWEIGKTSSKVNVWHNTKYRYINGECLDDDECYVGGHLCDTNAKCINNIGSYECQCNIGFSNDPAAMYADVSGARIGPDRSKLHTECENINECMNEDLNTCGDNGECIETVFHTQQYVANFTRG